MPAGGYLDIPHFVICPQIFQKLPEKYVAFQMEQSINSRWFTESYFQSLKNAFAIFDYSLTNIRFLNQKDIKTTNIYYMPIDYQTDFQKHRIDDYPEFDVVFYGDVNNERRQKYLTELSKYFRVKIVNEIYGEALYKILGSSKIVINIHYYENALLESTRIYEALSLNKLVISEKSSDIDEYNQLMDIVDFVDIDNIDAMVEHVQYWLSHESERSEKIKKNQEKLTSQINQFDYYFYRFLLATENIDFDQFWDLVGSKYNISSRKLCLNLPEFTDRSDSFLALNKNYGFDLFPGLRHSISWIGCGLSYKFIMKLAKKFEFPYIEVCEDDAEFSEDFKTKLDSVLKYLYGSDVEWDIFSGLLSDLSHESIIHSVTTIDNLKIAITDKMTGTVYGLYNKNIYDLFIQWDENNIDIRSNTIDRYVEGQKKLKIVTTYPFLIGHRDELFSTIWENEEKNGRSANSFVNDMISRSQKLLKEKIDSFEFFSSVKRLNTFSKTKERSLIAGMVILYNPNLNEVLKNIVTYLPFIDHLYIIDNTVKPDENYLRTKLEELSSRIEYIPNYANIGLAKPINIIAKKATKKGYKMLLTMDQDSSYNPIVAEKYFKYAVTLLSLKSEVAISSLNSSRNPMRNLGNEYHYHEVMRTNTSGSIFNLEVFNKIGGADERLFLDEVDREYCFRAIINGYKIYSFHNLSLTHNLGELKYVGYLGLFSKRYTELHSPKRIYFIKRNFLLISENYAHIFPAEFKHLRREHKKKIKYQLLCSPDWYKSLFQVIRGYIDYKRKKFG